MRTIRSSWNSDRVAAAYCSQHTAKRAPSRRAALYAQHKTGSDMVSVFTRRGREVFSRRFGDEIASAIVIGDELHVETANGGRFVCDAWTGRILESESPASMAPAEHTPADRQDAGGYASIPAAA